MATQRAGGGGAAGTGAARGAILPPRAVAAVLATRAVNAVSRRLGVGSGTVAGGRAGLAVDPLLLAHLAASREVALVSGTNGKTTTTRLLALALERRLGPAASNSTGSNMPAGHVTALVDAPRRAPAVLEVDEGYLPALVASLSPGVVVLLNLSRDQLDRSSEVRMVANRWRSALGQAARAGAPVTAVANADDPLVAWAALGAARPVWVGAGLSWRGDAVGCPSCDGTVTFPAAPGGAWACACGFRRPDLDVWLDGDAMRFADGRRLEVRIRLPGRFNRANAAMAVVAATVLGVPAQEAMEGIAGVAGVAGRFDVASVEGTRLRMMLAKNPAGWRELLDLMGPEPPRPVVVGINARIADGRDPSWLWDVPFEQLAGRPVVSTGERCRDLSVRLRYAGVSHETVPDPLGAVRAAARLRAGPGRGLAGDRAGSGGSGSGGAGSAGDAGSGGPGSGGAASRAAGPAVDFVGNYTAFYDLLDRAGLAVPGADDLRVSRARRR